MYLRWSDVPLRSDWVNQSFKGRRVGLRKFGLRLRVTDGFWVLNDFLLIILQVRLHLFLPLPEVVNRDSNIVVIEIRLQLLDRLSLQIWHLFKLVVLRVRLNYGQRLAVQWLLRALDAPITGPVQIGVLLTLYVRVGVNLIDVLTR